MLWHRNRHPSLPEPPKTPARGPLYFFNGLLVVVRVRWPSQSLALRPPPLRLQPGPALPSRDSGPDAFGFLVPPLTKSFPESLQCDGLIPMLTPLFSGRNDDSARLVRKPDTGLGHVLVLPPLSSGAEGVDSTFGEELFV